MSTSNKIYKFLCPCCNREITVQISEANDEKIIVGFLDNNNQDECYMAIRQLGYEFGGKEDMTDEI